MKLWLTPRYVALASRRAAQELGKAGESVPRSVRVVPNS